MTLMPIVAFPGLILPDTNTIRLLKIEKLMEYGFENSLNSCQQHLRGRKLFEKEKLCLGC